MRKTIAILLVAIMALTVVSSAGVVAAQDGHRNNIDHGKNFNDRERNRFDCIKLIKVRECVSPNCGAAFN